MPDICIATTKSDQSVDKNNNISSMISKLNINDNKTIDELNNNSIKPIIETEKTNNSNNNSTANNTANILSNSTMSNDKETKFENNSKSNGMEISANSNTLNDHFNETAVVNGEGDYNAEMNKHILHSSWTLWFMNGDNKTNGSKNGEDRWSSNLVELYTFTTVEDFWCLYSHIQLPAKLRVKNDYMLFRQGIKPQWEDDNNVKGGAWKLVLPSRMRNTDLDRLWLETVFSMIGEVYGDNGNFVNGAYLQRRQREDRILLWTSNADDRESTMTIGKVLKEKLCLTNESTIYYFKHEDDHNAANNGKHQSWQHRTKAIAKYQV